MLIPSPGRAHSYPSGLLTSESTISKLPNKKLPKCHQKARVPQRKEKQQPQAGINLDRSQICPLVAEQSSKGNPSEIVIDKAEKVSSPYLPPGKHNLPKEGTFCKLGALGRAPHPPGMEQGFGTRSRNPQVPGDPDLGTSEIWNRARGVAAQL